jgi:hypothetical protein
MLLIAVSNLKPAASTWQAVADRLGHGLNANAVRYYTSDCVSITSYFSLFCLACPLLRALVPASIVSCLAKG